MKASTLRKLFEANELDGCNDENAWLLATEIGSATQRARARSLLTQIMRLQSTLRLTPQEQTKQLQVVAVKTDKLLRSLLPVYRRVAAGIRIEYHRAPYNMKVTPSDAALGPIHWGIATIIPLTGRPRYLEDTPQGPKRILERGARIRMAEMVRDTTPRRKLARAADETADALLAIREKPNATDSALARRPFGFHPVMTSGMLEVNAGSAFERYCEVIEEAPDADRHVILQLFWTRLGVADPTYAAIYDLNLANLSQAHPAGLGLDHAVGAGYSLDMIIRAIIFATGKYKLPQLPFW